MEKAYYTLLETANIFKIRIRTVREWLKIGKIQAAKHGTMWRVSASEIDRLKEKMLPTNEKYYSIEEVAARYGVSISTVRRWLHNGLASYKPTGKKEVYISETSLNKINEYRHK